METQIRPLTLDEMYFKKATTLHLPAQMNQNSLNNSFQESAGPLNPVDSISKTPTMDLSNQVFPETSFPEKAGMFIKKNWVWLLLGTGVIITCIVIHENNKSKKKQNQLPMHSPYST